jgi:hypothetical protein
MVDERPRSGGVECQPLVILIRGVDGLEAISGEFLTIPLQGRASGPSGARTGTVAGMAMTVSEPSQPSQGEPGRKPRVLRQVPMIAVPGVTGIASALVAHVVLGERGLSYMDVVVGVVGVLVAAIVAIVAREIGETARTWIKESNETKRAALPYGVEQTLARTLQREVLYFAKAQSRRFWRLPLAGGRKPAEFPDLGTVMGVARNSPMGGRVLSASSHDTGDGSGNTHNTAKAVVPVEVDDGISPGSRLAAVPPQGRGSRPGGRRPRAESGRPDLKGDNDAPSA